MESTFAPEHESEADDTGKIMFPSDELKDIRDVGLPQEMGNGAKKLKITRSEILDFGNEVFLLHNVLSREECQHFIREGETFGFEQIHGARDNYRSQERMVLNGQALSKVLWERIQPWLSDITIEGDPHTQHIHGVKFLLQGTWTPTGLNPMWRLVRYIAGGHFAPHFDGFFQQSSEERSLQTFMLYLNGDFEGGSTNFVDEKQNLFMDADGKYCAEEKNILYRIQPEPGMAIIFNHHRLHEGQKLGNGVKYILRTDLMFRNINQVKRSAKEESALQMVLEAERREALGDCMEAAELYRKAFKLSPEVAAAYGN